MMFLMNERKCVMADASEIKRCCFESQDPRDQWTVERLVFIGAVRDVSGDLLNAFAFRAGLRSGQTSGEIEVRVDARTLARLLERMGPGAIREPHTIVTVVKDLLAAALSFRNCSFDPLRVSHWELEETSMFNLAPEGPQ
jgi:hypothetical protein